MKKLNHSSCISFVLFFSSWKRTKVINLWQTCLYQVCFYRYQVKKPLRIPQTENHLLPPRDTEIIAHISPILYQKISLSHNVQHKDSNICNASRTNRKDTGELVSVQTAKPQKKSFWQDACCLNTEKCSTQQGVFMILQIKYSWLWCIRVPCNPPNSSQIFKKKTRIPVVHLFSLSRPAASRSLLL